MKSQININFSDDPFYRYKMLSPDTSNEGTLASKITEVRNLASIANSLKRPLEHIIKHFELSLKLHCKEHEKAH